MRQETRETSKHKGSRRFYGTVKPDLNYNKMHLQTFVDLAFQLSLHYKMV